jgi:hypothetical protein
MDVITAPKTKEELTAEAVEFLEAKRAHEIVELAKTLPLPSELAVASTGPCQVFFEQFTRGGKPICPECGEKIMKDQETARMDGGLVHFVCAGMAKAVDTCPKCFFIQSHCECF